MDRFRNFIKTIFPYCIVAAVIFLLFKYCLFNCYVPSSSMTPTLESGDRILAVCNPSKIERYDIVMFKFPDDESRYFVKRVIGLPRETIEIRTDGHVYANGELLDDSFIREPMAVDTDVTYEVPDGCYLMLGDNRNESWDSRYWDNTFVTEEEITAKGGIIYWPLNHVGLLSEK